jgi:hypothetical protein
MTPEQENPRTAATNEFFEQVRVHETTVLDYMPVGEIGTHHWVAALTYHFSKALPWGFDLRAFCQVMVSTAAVCLRAALWADRVMHERAEKIEEIREKAKGNDNTGTV